MQRTMLKKLFIVLFCISFSSLHALVSINSDSFTLYNTGENFSYGYNTGIRMDFQGGPLSAYSSLSLTTCKNLQLPFDSFTIFSSKLNTFNYSTGISCMLNPVIMRAGIFGTQFLDNQFSAFLFGCRIRTKNSLGINFSITFSDRLTCFCGFFGCSPEIIAGTNNAAGNAGFIFGDLRYKLISTKADYSFSAGFLHGSGTFDFSLPVVPVFLINHNYSGNGTAELNAAGAGFSISTRNLTVNMMGKLGMIYIIDAEINADIYHQYKMLLYTSSDYNKYEEDFSNTLIIPFSFEGRYTANIRSAKLHTKLSKTLAIPIRLNKNPSDAEDESKEKNSTNILKTLLLSGINLSVSMEF